MNLSALTPSVWSIVNQVLLTAGMFYLFIQCEIPKWWALVPFYREVKLAEWADEYEDGITLFTLEIVQEISSILAAVLVMRSGMNHIRTLGFFGFLSILLTFGIIVYRFRVYVEVAKKLSTRKIWGFIGAFVEFIPVLYWAFNPKVKAPRRIAKAGGAAALSGITAEKTKEGLVIDIEARTVKQKMKTKYLLRDIHLNIKPGRMVLLLGGSGAGKTTFLNAVTGYEQAKAQITLNGMDVYHNFDKMKYEIGFVPQQDLIRYNDTVEKTLNDAASLRLPNSYTRTQRAARVKEVLEIFGLAPVKNNTVVKQSGGQKKRISIASEFIADPFLFILDEPDSGLDGILAKELMERLHKISREGKIVIVITHTPDRVIEQFDDIIVLAKDANRTGRLVYYGSVEEAKVFFEVENMEQIVRKINREDEGGEGLADVLIEKYAEVCHGKNK